MSSRRSRSRQSGSSRITEDQIADLVSKLQRLIPEIRNRHSDKVHTQAYIYTYSNTESRYFTLPWPVELVKLVGSFFFV